MIPKFLNAFHLTNRIWINDLENDQAHRQLKTLKSKKAATVAAMKKPPARKQMDEAQMKEVEIIENHVIKLIFDVANFRLFSTSTWICKSKQTITRGI